MAATIAAGVHHSANRSTKRCVGAREAAASSTSLTMRATVLSDAPRVVRIRSSPASAFTDPANTVSPGPRATGTLSPVTVLSSKADLPSTISPSHGTRSPGRTWTMSPTASRTAATSSTPPPTPSRRAVRGMRPPRRANASAGTTRRHALQHLAHCEEKHDGSRFLSCADRHRAKGRHAHQRLDGERRARPRQRDGSAAERDDRNDRGDQEDPIRRPGKRKRQRPCQTHQHRQNADQPRFAGPPPLHVRRGFVVPVRRRVQSMGVLVTGVSGMIRMAATAVSAPIRLDGQLGRRRTRPRNSIAQRLDLPLDHVRRRAVWGPAQGHRLRHQVDLHVGDAGQSPDRSLDLGHAGAAIHPGHLPGQCFDAVVQFHAAVHVGMPQSFPHVLGPLATGGARPDLLLRAQ